MRPTLCILAVLAALALPARAETPAAPQAAMPQAATGTAGTVLRTHAVSILSEPALPPSFPYFPYVNPDAPKGGELAQAALGSFDSFNPFIVAGTPAAGITGIWDTLLRPSAQEAATAYGHLAQTVELPADKSWVAFDLRPEARFHDGTPVTAEDVVWTFDTLREKGRPTWRVYYADVDRAEADGERRVVFHFRTTSNRELPLILGELPVLPKHWWQGRDFSRPLTDPPLGSGTYRVGRFEFGRTVTYERVPDYWAAKLPTGRGLSNFDTLRFEYFRDATVAFEAFKAGQVDFREENIAKNWATAYDFPAVQRGLVRKEEIRHHLPTGMQGFAMNTRRPLFQDRRVREALAMAFDFEWENKNLFFNAYTRTESYFSNSDLASSGLPQGAELALLEPYRDRLPPEVFTREYKLPVTDGSGNNREGLKRALDLLRQAGWTVKDRKLQKDGQPFSFEILLADPGYERVFLPYVQWLARLGIEARVRSVDPAQFEHRTDAFDYDMSFITIPASERPGNELSDYWSCASAKAEGSQNLMGVCDPVVDALVQKVIQAQDLPSLTAATRALDRVLLWGWYVVPNWHLQIRRVAVWDKYARPDKPVRPGFVLDDWWAEPQKAVATESAKRDVAAPPPAR